MDQDAADTEPSLLARLPKVREAQCLHAGVVTRSLADLYGLPVDEAEDCVQEFLERLLTRSRQQPSGEALLYRSPAWLYRAAENWVKNTVRAQRRRQHREVAWSEVNQWELSAPLEQIPSPQLSPEAMVIRAELWQRFLAEVIALSPRQLALFRRHFLQEEPIVIEAQFTGRTANARYQAMWKCKGRLRRLLEQAGLDIQEIQEYLLILAGTSE